MAGRSAPPDERGEASTQFVVLVPLLFALALLIVQAALWFHAANVATSAAARGAGAGAPRSAGAGDAESAARAVVEENGGRLSNGPVVDLGAETVVVEVTLDVPRLVPFFPDSVRRSQTEPRERFVPEPDR